LFVLRSGRHTFVSWAENTDALVADLLPGKIYFVEVDRALVQATKPPIDGIRCTDPVFS